LITDGNGLVVAGVAISGTSIKVSLDHGSTWATKNIPGSIKVRSISIANSKIIVNTDHVNLNIDSTTYS
jgi:hypothetical protein